jgi:FkbH-like protein/FkbM family methyltransferase
MNCLVGCSANGPQRELHVGLSSLPYLVDHGLEDMTVLPGSFYIDTALAEERKLTGHFPGVLRNVIFQNPIILAEEDTVIRGKVRDCGNGRVEYAFYEGGSEDCAARLELDRAASIAPKTDEFSIDAFQARSHEMIDSKTFYRKLRENGNQYGPQFQKVSAIWRDVDQCLGKILVSGCDDNYVSLLDAMTQLLAPFVMETGKTFILRSIDRIEIAHFDLPDTVWAHATKLDEQALVGDVRVFDQSGKTYLELFGVAFNLLDRPDEEKGTKLVVAANFTAEPLQDSLEFWAEHFGSPIGVEFAPYNQVFQQLLDAGSVFARNRQGVNVILLALDEWCGMTSAPASLIRDERKAQQCFGNHLRYVLPNGLEIVHLNQYETDYVYKEIFEDQCYLRHGITLHDGDTVVDIGANIGLFSLFAMTRCKDPKIYAFEPAPVVYELLKANCEAYGSKAHAFNLGVSDTARTATFAFYEKSSVFSGFHSDEVEDRAAIQTVVRNILNGEGDEYVAELTADRLRCSTHECRLISVSDIIRENQLEKVNLLKIDAEKSELEILKGIDDRDWPKIEQVVMEIHDRTGEAVKRITELLARKGYRCAVQEETLLQQSGLFSLYATRETRPDARVERLKRNIQEFCAALGAFMNQAAAPLVLCSCPRSTDIQDNAGLDDAEQTLLLEARKVPNVHAISSAALLQRYALKGYHDPHARYAGHIPYTSEGYAAIGTAVMRTIFKLRGNPFKVLVLDCDNTLWKGVCGEDGPRGIEVTPPYRLLQEFMIRQMEAGMLLCLCSKNNENDALDVFDQRTDMLLKREHLVSWRLNWNSKSENIKSLAKELNLGLDSFIFIDDNPVDCADVKINCPGVLTLQLPGSAESFASFLNHIWAFDDTASTTEDQNRTRMYQENTEREKFREQALSLKDFIKGLQLRVEIAEATEDQFGRVSQLTFRTNQFNFTTIRRSENEVREFLKRENTKCLAVRVADRFGDYGLVGVVMYEAEADRYKVDTFLLSCRVLGRGVEHAVVAWLGRQAVKDEKTFVEMTYRPTEKNLPALEFFKSLGASGTTWTFRADRFAAVEYDSGSSAGSQAGKPAIQQTKKSAAQRFGFAGRSERLQRIAENLSNVNQITKAIEEYRLKKESVPCTSEVAAGSTLETALLNIWRKVLGRPRIGVQDNFLDAGGTSLRAVQVVAAIKKELKYTLSIVSLFECPTVSLLAAKLTGRAPAGDVATRSADAAARGQRRRYKMGARASTPTAA